MAFRLAARFPKPRVAGSIPAGGTLTWALSWPLRDWVRSRPSVRNHVAHVRAYLRNGSRSGAARRRTSFGSGPPARRPPSDTSRRTRPHPCLLPELPSRASHLLPRHPHHADRGRAGLRRAVRAPGGPQLASGSGLFLRRFRSADKSSDPSRCFSFRRYPRIASPGVAVAVSIAIPSPFPPLGAELAALDRPLGDRLPAASRRAPPAPWHHRTGRCRKVRE